MTRGIDFAASQVAETDEAIVWPGRMVWADAQTVTTLIEGHGGNRDAVIRPRYQDQVGWPALLPMSALPLLRGRRT